MKNSNWTQKQLEKKRKRISEPLEPSKRLLVDKSTETDLILVKIVTLGLGDQEYFVSKYLDVCELKNLISANTKIIPNHQELVFEPNVVCSGTLDFRGVKNNSKIYMRPNF